MEIDKNPPGLISRRAFPIDRGRWLLHEEWDIAAPGCPMIRSPFHPQPGNNPNRYIRQIEMTAEAYAAYQQLK